MHVRGGDIMGPAGAYFKHAMERMEQEKPGVRYIVFTNDMERAEEALAPVLESQKKTQWDRQKTGWNLSQRWENFRMWMNFPDGGMPEPDIVQ